MLRKSVNHNLTAYFTPLIGREQQLEQLIGLLHSNRLLTLIGAGGVGKTRLAIEVGRSLLPEFGDGVWFVDLAVVSDPMLLAQTVVELFKMPAVNQRTPLGLLIAYLRERQVLLILDNCEHLIEACAQLAEQLLVTCPDVRILATSRERLRCAGEVEWRVPSLTWPHLYKFAGDNAAAQGISPRELQNYEAVRLFVVRVQMSEPSFVLNADNAVAIAQICSRLDGIPLALEMAATRATSMTVQEIAIQLTGMFDQRFALLTTGARTAHPRQRTLHAAMEWSFGLLAPNEQWLLAQISVFCGRWTAGAAEFVAGNPNSDLQASGKGLTSSFLGLLSNLVNKSLVSADRDAGPTRYSVLETVRQFGAEKLRESRATDEVRGRHLAFYVNLVKHTDLIMLAGPRFKAQLVILDGETDNLRAALQWAQMAGDLQSLAQLAAGLWPYWRDRGNHQEGRKWLGIALAAGSAVPLAIQARIQVGLAALLFYDDTAPMISAGERAAELSRAAVDFIGLAWSYTNLGVAYWRRQDYATAQNYLEQGLALARSTDTPEAIMTGLICLGNIMINYGEHRRSATYYEACVMLAQKWREPSYLVWSLRELAYLNITVAMATCERELARHRAAYGPEGFATILQCFGRLLLEHGDYTRAKITLTEAVAFWHTLESQWCANGGLALALFDLALAGWLHGDSDLACESFTQSLTLFRQVEDVVTSFHVHLQFGYFWLECTDPVQAYGHFLECLRNLRTDGWATRAAVVVAGLAEVASLQGERLVAARLFGAAEKWSDNLDLRTIRCERVGFDRVLNAAHTRLVDPVYASGWAEGATWTWQAAAEYAVDVLDPCLAAEPTTIELAHKTFDVADVSTRKQNPSSELTAREIEVLGLVARGLTDNQIAQRLVISPRTVNTHLTSIFRKLNVPSRTAAVRYALEHSII